MNRVNSLMIDMYDEGGKLAEYSTQIIKTSKNITLLAQRVTDNEQDIGNLTVTARQISQTVEHQQDEIDSVTGTVSSHTTQIGQLQTTAQQITASVLSLTTTVDGHTQSIGQLIIRDNEISQKVTVIEGDYVKNAQISLMVTKDGNGYISNALISADKISFETFTWEVINPTTKQTTFFLDNNGNLIVAGTISSINSGNIQITQDVNFYVNSTKFARFASTVSSFEAMLYLRNDGGPCISAQSFSGGIGLSVLANSGARAIVSTGPCDFILRAGETLSIGEVSYSPTSQPTSYFAPGTCLREESFTLPSSPSHGTLLFCKGMDSDMVVTTKSHPIVTSDGRTNICPANSQYNFNDDSFILIFSGKKSKWILYYCY